MTAAMVLQRCALRKCFQNLLRRDSFGTQRTSRDVDPFIPARVIGAHLDSPSESTLFSEVPHFEQAQNPHIGRVLIIGAANAGKSTLLNTLLTKKVRPVV